MRLLLRGKPMWRWADKESGRVNPAYRGTDRDRVTRLDDLEHWQEIREAIDEFDKRQQWSANVGSDDYSSPDELEDIERYGWVTDVYRNLDIARFYAQLYRRYVNPDLELIEVTHGKKPPKVGIELLGFDVAAAYDESLLSYGLKVGQYEYELYPWESQKIKEAYPLELLREKYFMPSLNANGLFDDYETASFYLECETALYKLVPDLWPDGFRYEVLGIYLVE